MSLSRKRVGSEEVDSEGPEGPSFFGGAASERAHAPLPSDPSIEITRAHALMFLGRAEEAKEIYLAHKGERISAPDGDLWDRVIAEDFRELGKDGLTHPMMAEIEKRLGVSP